ncbi:hypothetical protein SDC9_157150 [bioreactor metagenome]|uniref:Uncharacterized protein n=1 Tax=bioreactor metagenome TaxID=1076179 RepID=A0A645F6P7_9ZZZZ
MQKIHGGAVPDCGLVSGLWLIYRGPDVCQGVGADSVPEQHLQADEDQYRAAEDVAAGAQQMPGCAPQPAGGGGQQRGHDADGRRLQPDVRPVQAGQTHADDQRVDAGGEGEHGQLPQSENRERFAIVLENHLAADGDQQNCGDMAAVILNPAADHLASQPADNRHNRLKAAEEQGAQQDAAPGEFPALDRAERRGHRRSVHREAQGQEQGFRKIHDNLSEFCDKTVLI